METVNIDCGCTGKLIGSETARAPLGMVNEVLLLKVTVGECLVG